MKYFLSFMGYPRSGHTLVAAILNANPNVVCSNQLNIFNDIEHKVKVMDGLDNFLEYIKNYSIQTNTWKDTTQILHVPKEEITVVGDKTGHRTVDILNKNPERLGIFKQIIGVPIKWILVVRNPFDNIATWGKLNYTFKTDPIRKHKNPHVTEYDELQNCINEYRILNETIFKLRRSEDVLKVNHEYVITRMHNTLEEISDFLEISFDPIWRDNVRNAVWKKPRLTRGQVSWTTKQKQEVNDIINQYEWLEGYEFGGCGRCSK